MFKQLLEESGIWFMVYSYAYVNGVLNQIPAEWDNGIFQKKKKL